MNQKDVEIIRFLRNGERNISNIARKLKLPISTVSERVRRIEEKYIAKHSSLLDYNKLGYFANTFLAIKTEKEQRQELFDFLKSQNCVNSVHSTGSDYNFLVEVVCRDSLELVNWIEDIKGKFPLEMMHFQVLKTEERERFVPGVGEKI